MARLPYERYTTTQVVTRQMIEVTRENLLDVANAIGAEVSIVLGELKYARTKEGTYFKIGDLVSDTGVIFSAEGWKKED